MQKKMLWVALAWAFAQPATATPSGDVNTQLAEMQAQISQMKAAYEARIAALEGKLAEAAKPGPAAAAVTAVPTNTRSGAAAFNPEVSLILQGAYKGRKKVAERQISGFWSPGHDHADEHDHGHDKRGFSLDHTELVFSANIDDTFRGQATLALLDGEVELEEAWFQTLGLGHGVGLKAGRFFSGIGYLNEQHPHQWDFYDQPLMYKALFGEHSYAQDGVQAKWVAPTDLFVELGAEFGRGQNFPGTERNSNGANSRALFARIGDDWGTSHSWRAGISHLRTEARERETHMESGLIGDHAIAAFDGRSRVWLADFVYKWAPEGNPKYRNFKFQAEYFRRQEDGRLSTADEDGVDLGVGNTPYASRQSGFYLQGVYQFTPNWRAGLRYDRLNSGRQDLGSNPAGLETVDYRPSRTSAMVDYSWSEYARLRLQLARDRSMQGVTDNQVTLQYIMSLGSHGAHKF